MQKIAFIGLGNMGLPMARNLAQAGYDVRGCDQSPDVDFDVVPVAEAVTGADVVITMLPNGAIVADVLAKITPHLSHDAIVVDCSTIQVDQARANHAKIGARFLDAPVSGGIGGASAGTLTFIVGGDAGVLDGVRPLFDVMGARVVHCGGPGAGQAAKICNNMVLAISMVGTCEALAMGDRLGLDRDVLFDVLSTSTGSCWSVNSYFPRAGAGPDSPADHNFTPGFPAELMVKDMGLTQDAARSVGQPTPLGALTLTLYQQFVENGGTGTDFSGIIQYLEGMADG